ncbi:MAG: VanZ family protein [Clostridia bacterium]|nr:VanZ family protein [Clostridia bacterium]
MNKKWLCISLVILLFLTAFILYNAGQSSESSHEDTVFVEDVLLQGAQIVPPHLRHYTVRKAAHLFEYALLGAMAVCVLNQLKKRWGAAVYGFGLFYVLAVGVLDEYVQSFTNRSSLLSDVLLDFCGALIGMAIAMGVLALVGTWLERVRTRNMQKAEG